MSIDRTTRLFFDASCLIAGAASATGGSGFLLALCARGLLRAVVSHPVLMEVERNISAKLAPAVLDQYHAMLQLTPMYVAPVPLEGERRRYQGIINEKDQHVVAAAITAEAPFLITLDRSLAAEVNAVDLPIRALSPGEFITMMLPTHPEYPSVRE